MFSRGCTCGGRGDACETCREKELVRPTCFDPTVLQPQAAPSPCQVVVLMRHGDRTPIPQRIGCVDFSRFADAWESLLPNAAEQAALESVPVRRSPAFDGRNSYAEFVGSRPWGQLTSRGLAQCRTAGSELRRRYPNAKLRVFSTDFPRTVQSAAAVVLGFAPVEETPVVVRPPSEETLLPNFDGACIQYAELRARRVEEAIAGPLQATRQELTAMVEPVFGEGAKMLDLRPFCIHEKTVGSLDGVDWALAERAEAYSAAMEAVVYADPELVRLACGRLTHEVLAALLAPGCDVTLLLAHDNMLTAFLVALGVYRQEWPVYASMVALETSDFDGNRKVRILVNDEPRRDWVDLAELDACLRHVAMTSEDYAFACAGSCANL
eukprot:TRINITY_DN74019_c0_g1_i1.p1 TRINITY_DN74019_c0_g1~~TRINITY_DN74019_c0_g1_i1.p1  ORF type:complete len:381 (+),score=45.12 TRINITY_DN74019_c0_g1_i1:76-1218(+)